MQKYFFVNCVEKTLCFVNKVIQKYMYFAKENEILYKFMLVLKRYEAKLKL